MEIDWKQDGVQVELGYQKVIPTVTYQDIAVSILLDLTSKNKRVDDNATLIEAYVANVEKNILNDGVTLSDSVVKYIIKDYFGDEVLLTDVLDTVNVFLRDKFEGIRVDDSEQDLLNNGLVGGFLLNGLGSTTVQLGFTPQPKTDIAAISDVLAAVTNKLFSDTANISDGTTSNIAKYLASGLSLNDSANVNTSVTESADNIATMSDTISVSLILSRMLGSTTINEITLN
jgi:hypothetical protein